jgi:hypothetical protein
VNYQPQGTLNAILTMVMIILVIYIFPFRDLRLERINKRRNQEVSQRQKEQADYLREQNTVAQAKRDEQIRLLTELVELEKHDFEMQKQSLDNQKEILETLNRR